MRRYTASVIELLELRGVAVPAEVRERVLACRDLATLHEWFRRAVTAKSIEEVVAG